MKISLCVITKDEEKNIERCINSVKSIVDEIVVVDTGSADHTVKIVEELGGKVYYFEWINDFAAARNYALSKVNGDWIIFLDADEYVSKDSLPMLRPVIEKAHQLKLDVVETDWININQVNQTFQSSMPITRILKKSPLLGYKGKIHETIHKIKGNIKKLDAVDSIKIFHIGYSTDIVQEKKKSDRNIQLLYKELEKKPNSSNIHFYLAESFNLDGKVEKVLEHIKEVFKYHNGNLNGIYQKSYFYQLNSMIALKYEESDIIEIYNKAIHFDKTYPDYEIAMGKYYVEKGEYRKAVSYFSQCIEKMNTYKGSSESWVSTNAKQVFKIVANLYYMLQDYEGCVKYLIFILNVYKDDEESLIQLLKILKDRSSLEEIFSIINKIYDMTLERDKIIVLRACVALKDPKISAFVKDILENQN